MIRLEKDLHYIAERAIRDVPINHLFALSVIENKADGQIFTDSFVNPRAFYVKHPYGMSLLFGEIHVPSFKSWLINYLVDADHLRKSDEWLQAYPRGWDNEISNLASKDSNYKPNMEFHQRVNFKFNQSQYQANRTATPPLHDEASLVRTSPGVFENHEGTVIPWYFWKNSEDFTQNGVGFTVMADGEPASTAFSAFVHAPYLELGIETSEKFRGRGYAYEACSALIDHCLERNIEPVWACRAENVGSMKLANKLGFEESIRIPYYRFKPKVV